jgi:hypothetical protein
MFVFFSVQFFDSLYDVVFLAGHSKLTLFNDEAKLTPSLSLPALGQTSPLSLWDDRRSQHLPVTTADQGNKETICPTMLLHRFYLIYGIRNISYKFSRKSTVEHLLFT